MVGRGCTRLRHEVQRYPIWKWKQIPPEILFGKSCDYPNIAFGTHGIIPDRSQHKKSLDYKKLEMETMSWYSERFYLISRT